MDLPKRKNNRVENYDYGQNGAYFITICVKDRKRILCNIVNDESCVDIVGACVPERPKNKYPNSLINLLHYGKIADKYIKQLNAFYDNISVEKYVIMPDHIHMLLVVENGQSRTPVPTMIDNKNSVIAKFVSTLKRFCNKEYGENIWQPRYYDHIIRNESDYIEIMEYIENNPIKWVLNQK